jgi:hypothetical protein
MRYIEAPERYIGRGKSLFIAGGISNCKRWQDKLIKLLENESITILNPRRKKFEMNNSSIEEEQITWEYKCFEKATAVSFWFPSETLCPITLYELGKLSTTRKPLFIGVDPKYSRIRDVKIQTSLIRPEIEIVYTLQDLAKQIKKWARN